MEYALLFVVFVLGLVANAVFRSTRQQLRARASRRQVQVGPVYDTKIDAITDIGLERYNLHRAQSSPEKRAALRGTPLYEKAAPVLGWDD